MKQANCQHPYYTKYISYWLVGLFNTGIFEISMNIALFSHVTLSSEKMETHDC
jgi:hypothetical protein